MKELKDSDNADVMAINNSDIVNRGKGNKKKKSEGGSSGWGQRMKEVMW